MSMPIDRSLHYASLLAMFSGDDQFVKEITAPFFDKLYKAGLLNQEDGKLTGEGKIFLETVVHAALMEAAPPTVEDIEELKEFPIEYMANFIVQTSAAIKRGDLKPAKVGWAPGHGPKGKASGEKNE